MGFTLSGLLLLAAAQSFPVVLLAAALVGTGSSVFHPESSRVARMASGGRHGLAQSLFQVGGNFGSSLGPLLAALIIAPYGKGNVAWFSLAALLGIVVLLQISKWYRQQNQIAKKRGPVKNTVTVLPRRTVAMSLGILLVLVFSKYFYLASLSSYYTFYLMQKFHVSVQSAQVHLFVFLFGAALGTIASSGTKAFLEYVYDHYEVLGAVELVDDRAQARIGLEQTVEHRGRFGMHAFGKIAGVATWIGGGLVRLVQGLGDL